MADDVRTDVDPFRNIGRRIDLVFSDGMVYGFAETVENRGAYILDAVADIVIGVAEIRIAGVVFIQMEQRKNVADVHQPAAGIVQRGVMQPGVGQVQLPERFADVSSRSFSGYVRRQIAAVEFADRRSGLFSRIQNNLN